MTLTLPIARIPASELRVGDEVLTSGGVEGVVSRIADTPRPGFIVVWVNDLATVLYRDDVVLTSFARSADPARIASRGASGGEPLRGFPSGRSRE